MEVTIKPEEFNFLLDKVKKLKKGERLIKLDNEISLMFRYSKVRTGNIYKEELMFPVLDPKTDSGEVVSLVFDAKGLYNNFITEIGVFREDKTYTMHIVPQREDTVINSFRKLLIEESRVKQIQDPNEIYVWRSKLYISIVISIIIILFNIVYQVHYGVHFTGLMIMAVSEVFILVILGNAVLKKPEIKEMNEETMKRLEQILNSKYDNDGQIKWFFQNVIVGVGTDLYFESAFTHTFIKLESNLVESVNSFLRDNGWEINEVSPYCYFTLKRYET